MNISPYFPIILLNGAGMDQETVIGMAIQSTYAIQHDYDSLRAIPASFEKLRGDYPVRREFHAFTIKSQNIDEHTLEKLRILGFTVE